MKKPSAIDYYSSIASSFRSISDSRSRYLNSVDDLVCAQLSATKLDSWLDVGTGDGHRLHKLMNTVVANNVIGIEPVESLALEARNLLGTRAKVIKTSLEDYRSLSYRNFQLVTALWNIIGHSEHPEQFLSTAYEAVEKGGHLLFDANNRYNVRYYGFLSVLKNLIFDVLGLGQKGRFLLTSPSGKISTIVYIANPFEVRSMLRSIGATNIRVLYVDYTSGARANLFTGQMLFHVIRE